MFVGGQGDRPSSLLLAAVSRPVGRVPTRSPQLPKLKARGPASMCRPSPRPVGGSGIANWAPVYLPVMSGSRAAPGPSEDGQQLPRKTDNDGLPAGQSDSTNKAPR